MINSDELYMRRAIELAQMAEGFTAPNPLVGAVIVHHHRIIGEGYHHCAGMPHAEVEAVRSVKPQDVALLPEATLYVSLEPCSHYGKTPPCADMLVQKRFRRVVIAMEDPFPQVAGRGIRKLKEAGIEVTIGILEAEARSLNRVFLTNVEKQRPFVTLKWAESADGYIDALRNAPTDKPIRFSDPLRERHVHRLRHLHDAILIGRQTLLADNPLLTNRLWWGKSPVRIVLDSQLSTLGEPCRLWKDSSVPVRIVCDADAPEPTNLPPHVSLIRKPNSVETGPDEATLPELKASRTEGVSERRKQLAAQIPDLLRLLYAEGIRSLLVEGGATTLQSFVDSGLYDTIDREVSPILLHSGIPAPRLS